ncbi:hypothetical protein [Novosphingobium sp. 9]|uniref:hypothetical protein n=1 Tax=Novosphingobium sp. 9 TaxID=2025349 RepID=UPI0021B6A47D|nr:hypothetical protein [Novosphingobium sp. 9]
MSAPITPEEREDMRFRLENEALGRMGDRWERILVRLYLGLAASGGGVVLMAYAARELLR